MTLIKSPTIEFSINRKKAQTLRKNIAEVIKDDSRAIETAVASKVTFSIVFSKFIQLNVKYF